MREYATVSPRFWTGTTGRQIRARGRGAQLLALYLVTAPESNMIGLYHVPLATLCAHVNMTTEEARAALGDLAAVGFARYDFEAEIVWVIEGASYQLGRTLKRADKRNKGAVRLLWGFRGHPFALAFHRKYKTAYELPGARPLHAPSMPPRSQEQEQEQEQNDTPPFPPAHAGGDRSATGNGYSDPFEEAIAYVVAKGERAWSPVRRKVRDWFKAGCTLAEVKARIDAGEHERRSPL